MEWGGEKVDDWHYFKTLTEGKFPIVAILNGSWANYTIEGKYSYTTNDSSKDLFIKPKVKECWVNVHELTHDKTLVVSCFNTEKEANDNKTEEYMGKAYRYIKTIRITDEPE